MKPALEIFLYEAKLIFVATSNASASPSFFLSSGKKLILCFIPSIGDFISTFLPLIKISPESYFIPPNILFAILAIPEPTSP